MPVTYLYIAFHSCVMMHSCGENTPLHALQATAHKMQNCNISSATAIPILQLQY